MGSSHLFQSHLVALATSATWPQTLASHRKSAEFPKNIGMGDLCALGKGIQCVSACYVQTDVASNMTALVWIRFGHRLRQCCRC